MKIPANDPQDGQTGKGLMPGLTVIVNISGGTQHRSVMRDSRVIIDVSKPEDVPRFYVSGCFSSPASSDSDQKGKRSNGPCLVHRRFSIETKITRPVRGHGHHRGV